MGRLVHIPYTVGQDEDGVWCAHAYVGRVGCNGSGDTREETLTDLRDAVTMVLEDVDADPVGRGFVHVDEMPEREW